MKKIILPLLFIALFAVSCTDKGTSLVGDCTPINASLTKHNFDKAGGIVEITTDNVKWWLNDYIETSPQSETANTYEEKTDLDGNIAEGAVLAMESDWFEVCKKSEQKLSIKFAANSSDAERWIKVELQAGNCFETITVNQATE